MHIKNTQKYIKSQDSHVMVQCFILSFVPTFVNIYIYPFRVVRISYQDSFVQVTSERMTFRIFHIHQVGQRKMLVWIQHHFA